MTVRMRHTKGHRNNRRAHHALEKPAVSLEGEAKIPHLRHRASPTTATYKGIKIPSLEKKNSKRIQKEAAKNN